MLWFNQQVGFENIMRSTPCHISNAFVKRLDMAAGSLSSDQYDRNNGLAEKCNIKHDMHGQSIEDKVGPRISVARQGAH